MEVHYVIDIETLATSAAAHVLSVAAVCFTVIDGKQGDLHGFEVRVSPEGQERREIDFDTVAWWANREGVARANAFDGPSVSVKTMFKRLADFVDEHMFGGAVPYVWAKSPAFDLSILSHLEASLGNAGFELLAPHESGDVGSVRFPFRAWRDVRTAAMVLAEQPQRTQPEHVAFFDAYYEALVVREFLAMRDKCDED
jgi:hypothetical protein